MASILLVGDSITEAFPCNDLLRNHTVINKGVYGDNTRLLLQRLDRDVLNQRCDMAFLLIGTNDMASGFSNGETISNIGRILRAMSEHSVASALFLQSILPTRGLSNRPLSRIAFLNLQLRRISAMHRVRYLDIGSLFVNSSGEIDDEFSLDGLHLTQRGYAVWGEFLNELITAQSNFE